MGAFINDVAENVWFQIYNKILEWLGGTTMNEHHINHSGQPTTANQFVNHYKISMLLSRFELLTLFNHD